MSRTGGTTTTQSTTAPPGFQMPFIQRSFDEALNLFESPGPSFYPGSTVARFTEPELEAQQGVLDFGRTIGPDIFNRTREAFNFGLGDVLSPETNPYLAATAEGAIRPITTALTEQVLPSIRAGSDLAGGLGGTRQALAEAQAVERATQAMGDTTANIYSNAYNRGLSTFENTMAMAPMLQALGIAPSEAIGAVGAQQRGEEQALINEAIQRHEFEQNLPYTKLVEFANLIRGPFGGTGESIVEAPEISLVEELVSGGAQLIPLITQLAQIFRSQ